MIYLDNAATSFPKPEEVYRTLDGFARSSAGNPGRAHHALARAAEDAILEARRLTAELLGASGPQRVVFTLNATDALNMAIKGVLRPGDHAITTDLEHNSVSRPLEGLAARGVITVTRLRSNDAGLVDPADLRAAAMPRTRLVAVCHASNVLGTVQDVSSLAAAAHAIGALLLVDGAQSAGALTVDVEAEGIDLFAFTGHKALLGPMGTGGLVLRQGVEVAAWREGGTGGDSSSPVQPSELPHRLEGGTPNAVGLAGFAAGVRWVRERGVGTIADHERAMTARLVRSIAGSPRVRIVAAPVEGPGENRIVGRTGLVAFTIDGYAPQEVAAILDQRFGIGVRAGLHCAPYIHKRWGLFPGGTVRASAGPFTTEADVDAAAGAILAVAAG